MSRTLYGKQVAAPFADNGAFVINAVENLMGSGDLISLRTRATNDRPFTVVQADCRPMPQAEFQQEAQALQARLTDAQQSACTNCSRARAPTAANVALTSPRNSSRKSNASSANWSRHRAELREVQHNLRKDIDAFGERRLRS